jgi:hypothetical protein
MTLIYAGAVVLVLATIWNVLARRGAVPFRPVEEAR